MLAYVFCVFSITIIGLSAAEVNSIPVLICDRKSENFSICAKNGLKEVFQLFIPGIPEIGFPPLEPLVFERESIDLNSNLIRGTLTVMNLSVFHLSMLDFCDVKANYQNNVFRATISGFLPNLAIEGGAKINGTIGVFTIVTEGYMNATIEGFRGILDLVGHVVNDTWIIEHAYATLISAAKFKLYYEALLKDNKQFDDLVIFFVNEYWPAISRGAWPFIRDYMDPWISNFLNKNVFSKLSFSKRFP